MKTAITLKVRPLLGALGAFFLAAAAHAGGAATTWHVRPDGNNVNCDGRSDAPDPGSGSLPRACAFRTPQKGVNVANGGDTVLLHTGTYNSPGTSVEGVSTILGFDLRTEFDSEDNRLTVKAAGDGPVIFDGGDSLDTGIVIWGTCFLTIEGIELRRFTGDTSVSFTYGAAGVNVGSPGPLAPSKFLILDSLVVRDATNTHAVGSFAEIAIWCEDCTDNTIRSTRIESVEPVAIALGSDSTSTVDQNGKILDTTVLHVRDSQTWTGLFAFHSNIWTVDGCYFTESAIPDGSTDLLRIRNSRNWAIVNSVFFRSPRAAINLVDDVVAGNLDEQDVVLNNTIECTASSTVGIRLQKTNSTQVRNNIVSGCTSSVLLADNCTDTLLGFNDLFDDVVSYDTTALAFGFTLVGSDIADDPLFERVPPRPDPFYRLQGDSPAIDAGDIENCGSIPPDGACDMGAFQQTPAGGSPPDRPSVVSVDAITGRTAVLHGSAFSDPDAGDTHTASRWQVDVLGGDFSNPVHDSGRTTVDLRSHKAGGLDPTTTYESRVRYEDENGHLSEWSDPAEDAGDQFTTLVATALPPKVTDIVPQAGATGVSVSTPITLTFNVPVAPASVTTSTLRLVRGGAAVPQAGGSPSVQGDGSVVVITPAGLLDPSTKFKIVVTGGAGGVLSRDGSVPGKDFVSAFTTETALESSSPASGATGVSVGVSPRLVFKWNVNASTATTATIKMKDLTSGKNVALTSVVAAGDTVTIDPASPLKANHKHQIIVVAGSSGLRFADGRRLGKSVKVTFKTAAP